MALEKQSAYDGVSLKVNWPEPPESTTVIGESGKQQVISMDEFHEWLSALSLSLQAQFDSAAREIEQLKSAAK